MPPWSLRHVMLDYAETTFRFFLETFHPFTFFSFHFVCCIDKKNKNKIKIHLLLQPSVCTERCLIIPLQTNLGYVTLLTGLWFCQLLWTARVWGTKSELLGKNWAMVLYLFSLAVSVFVDHILISLTVPVIIITGHCANLCLSVHVI